MIQALPSQASLVQLGKKQTKKSWRCGRQRAVLAEHLPAEALACNPPLVESESACTGDAET